MTLSAQGRYSSDPEGGVVSSVDHND